jgi:hypothetical protein
MSLRFPATPFCLAALAVLTAPAPAAAQETPPAIEVTGSVDWYYEYNFNRPDRYTTDESGDKVLNPVQNNLRNFDFKDNTFALNLAQITIKRAPAPVGFRLDLDFGKTADWIHGGEPGGLDTYRHIQQAFITAKPRIWGADDTLDIGKFVTSAGAEVIETKDNWNYTRGLLFALAIPYYHAGLRYSHPMPSGGAVGVQLLNGWNDVEDNNGSPSVGLTFTTPVGKGVTFTQNYIGGPELSDNNHDLRHLFDTVIAYTASDRLSFLLNTDYAREARPTGRVSWKGIAGYARYAITEKTAVAARLEYFDDPDGGATGTAQNVREATITYEWKAGNGLTTRAELRHDKSSEDVYLSNDNGTKDSQTTLLVGSVYAF